MKIHTILTVLLLTLLSGPLTASPEKDIKHVDLEQMYAEIDKAIESSSRYVGEYMHRIDQLKRLMAETTDESQHLLQMEQLSLMYESFDADSTLAYTHRTMLEARQGGYTDIEGYCMARLAYLCTFLGSQTEALTLLGRMDPATLTPEARCLYYRAYMMVYNNLASNTQLPELRYEFHLKYSSYMDSLLAAAPPNSEIYYQHREPQLLAENKYDEALKMNDERLNMTQEGTHENAIVSYSRYAIYHQMGDMEMAKYWVCKSALDDVRNAVMDQMSLIALSGLLDAEGDTDRANRYISFTWECNRRFSPHMRLWQIAPLLTAIEGNFQAKLDRKSRILTQTIMVVSSLLVVLLIVAVSLFRKRRQLRRAKAQLEETNERLANTNDVLRMLKHQ